MSRIFFWMAIFIFTTTMSLGFIKNARADNKVIIGWLENVYLPEYDFKIRAKIDTGAKNSSIHATHIEYIGKGKGEGSRIRFKVMYRKDTYWTIEANVLREVRIKKSRFIKRTRPEIEMEICLGEVRKRIRVNLEERGGMNYRMILGRTALEGDFLVDVSKIFITKSHSRKE